VDSELLALPEHLSWLAVFSEKKNKQRSCLRCLFLFTYNGVQHILCWVFFCFFFVLYTICCQFLCIVHFWMPFRCLIPILKQSIFRRNRQIFNEVKALFYKTKTSLFSNYIKYPTYHWTIEITSINQWIRNFLPFQEKCEDTSGIVWSRRSNKDR
jgi:hypothetical protein